MGNKFPKLCQMEARRLLSLLGIVFAVVLLVQYLELPYGPIISSLFPVGKAEDPAISNLPAVDLSNSPKILRNTTLVNIWNSTDFKPAHEMLNMTNPSEDDIGLTNDSVSGSNGDADNSLELDNDIDPEDELPENFVDIKQEPRLVNTTTEFGSAPGKAGESEYSSPNNLTATNNSSISSPHEESSFMLERNGDLNQSFAIPSFNFQPVISSPKLITPANVGKNGTLVMAVNSNASSSGKDSAGTLPMEEKSGRLQSDLTLTDNSSSVPKSPVVNKRPERPQAAVVSIAEMNNLLIESASSFSMKPRWSLAVDRDLLNAKLQIENAPIVEKDTGLDTSLYRNLSMFKRSYELMEQKLKVYIYKEGEKPVFHLPVQKGIYASEGWFMKQLRASKQFVTKNPRKAHLFYLPFSSRQLEEALYVPNSHNHKNLVQHLKNYLDMIGARYNFWNRTGGADHFLVACHDWAPSETREHMNHCIRALCNSDIKEGFEFGKDVSLPETYIRTPQNPLRELGGKPPSQRPILAFFAGNMHGYLRPILLKYWENKDPDMKIFGRLPKVKGKMNYVQHMKSSKYCICAKGFEVNSPRVVEAIFYECVPVIISDDFVPPFFAVLNWESFAVFVLEKDIPNLKNILLSIPQKRYLQMQRRVKKVQQHFVWHAKPVKYDIFHMILHSIWYNRVFRMRPR